MWLYACGDDNEKGRGWLMYGGDADYVDAAAAAAAAAAADGDDDHGGDSYDDGSCNENKCTGKKINGHP